jgi:hypothetical protein
MDEKYVKLGSLYSSFSKKFAKKIPDSEKLKLAKWKTFHGQKKYVYFFL